jgi:hypothetical protein
MRQTKPGWVATGSQPATAPSAARAEDGSPGAHRVLIEEPVSMTTETPEQPVAAAGPAPGGLAA